MAQHITLGWILSRKVNSNLSISKNFVATVAQLDIEEQMKVFWEIEEINQKTSLTQEQDLCE